MPKLLEVAAGGSINVLGSLNNMQKLQHVISPASGVLLAIFFVNDGIVMSM